MNIRTLAPALVLAVAACSAQVQTPATADEATPAASTGAQMDTFAMPANLLTTSSGLQYSIDRPGTGPQPQPGQTVTVHYSGWLTDGTPFDSSRTGAPLVFPIGQGRVIRGWEEALMAMKVGEVRTLVIPPSLGYGARGRGSVIPPNATLVFKVELLGVR